MNTSIKKISLFLQCLLKTAFGRTFVGFLISQGLFFVLLRKDLQDVEFIKKWITPQGIEYTQTAFFVLSVHVLVAFNTMIFLREALKPNSYLSKLTKEANRKAMIESAKIQRRFFSCVFISGGMAITIFVCNAFGAPQPVWVTVLHINEALSLIIFFIFVLADASCLRLCDIAINDRGFDPDDIKIFKCFRTTVKTYMLTCDGPGVVGLILIAVLSFTLHSHLAGLYWQGLVTGAIGLHMAFSQSALAFLSADELYVKYLTPKESETLKPDSAVPTNPPQPSTPIAEGLVLGK